MFLEGIHNIMSGSSLSAAILLAVLVIASASTDEDSLSTRRLKPVEPRRCPTGIGSENVHLPHEFDCTLFYHCSHGIKILKECALGLEFNEILEVCDWPFSAKCTLGNSDSGSSSPAGSSTTATSPVTGGGWSTTSGSSTTENEIFIPTECPAEWEGDSVHIAHEFDCGLFYHCDFGEKVLKECPPGLAFNPALQVCDWPEFAGCSLGGEGSTPSSSTSSTSKPSSSTTESSAPSVSTTESSATSVSWTQSSASSVSTTESSAPSVSWTESSATSVSTTESWLPSDTTTEGSSSSIWTTESSVPTEATTESEIIIPTECPANNEGDSVHLAHETDCNLFYQCDNGRKVLKQCAAGLHFNPVLQVCDWPESAGCSLGGSGGSGGSTTESSGSGGWTTSSSTDSGNGGDDATVIVPTECPDEFDDNNVHIAHESDCGSFYQCVHGEKVEKKCPAGLAFNPVLQVCDWPESAGCTLDESDATTSNSISSSSTTENSDTTDSGSGTWTTGSSGSGSSDSGSWTSGSSHTTGSGSGTWTTGSSGSGSSDSGSWTSESSHTTGSGSGTWTTGSSASGSSTTSSSGSETSTTESSGSGGTTTTDSGSGITVPTKCPANFEEDNVHLAHESDCGLFYQCVHGEKVERECPDGLHFNAVLQVCDWPESAGCNPDWSGGSGGSTSAGSTTESSSSGGPGSGSGSGSGTTEPGATLPTECSADLEADNVHLPHESDCGLFYQCVHGEKVQKECPPGLAFNPVLQVCDWPESAGCNLDGSGSGDSDDGTTDSTDTEWGSGSDGTTPADSSEWNSEEWEGGDEDDTTAGPPDNDDDTTDPVITIPTECPAEFEGDSVHIAHESDCGLFYHCVHGNKVVRECPAGLHFNPVLQVCDWPESAGCSLGGSGGSGSSTTESSGSGSSTTSSSTDSGNGGDDATVIVPTECPDEFDDNNVHIAHESDCGSFYQCVRGEKVEKKCPAGLAFNPVLQVCDWPESAGCTLDGSDATTSNSISSSSTTEGSDTTDSGSGTWTTGSSGSGSSDSGSWTSGSSHTTGSGSGTWTTGSSGSGSSVSGSWTSESSHATGSGSGTWTTASPGSGSSTTSSSGSGTWTTGSSGSSSTIDPDSGITSTVPTECPADFEDANTHIAHESECGLFYHCVHGEKVERECPAGLHFNPVLQVCDWPESAKCSLTGSGGSGPGGSGSGGSTTSSPGSGSSTTESGVTIIVPTECPINGFEDDSVHIAHETDCSIFYHCVHGEKVERRCPSGLHFNPVLQVCDWPESAGCVSSGPTTPAGSSEWESGEWTDSPGDDSGSTDSPNDSSESGSGGNDDDSDGGSGSDSGSGSGSSEIIVPTKCPEDFEDDNTHIAHETECYLFYQCVHGHKVPVKCPNGLHFNPVLQVCDWPESANCTLPGTGGSGPGDSSTSSPGSGSETTEPGVTVIPPTECPIDDSNGDSVHIADENNCGIFYHCVNGEKVQKSCPDGLHFNPVLQVCDWPESAGCESNSGSSDSSEWNDDSSDESGNSSTGSTTESDWQTTIYPDRENCVYPELCPIDDPLEYTIILPHRDCKKFCKCSNGDPYVYDCPKGLIFNRKLRVCDWTEATECPDYEE